MKNKIGEWEVHSTVDADGHLTVSVSRKGESVIEVDQELGNDSEWMSRFTTETIEESYRDSVSVRNATA